MEKHIKYVVILFFVSLFSIFFSGCSNVNNDIVSKNNVTAVPIDYGYMQEKIQAMENAHIKFSNSLDDMAENYWRDVLKIEKENIDYLIEWVHNNEYFDRLEYQEDELYVEPSNIKKKLKNSNGFKKIKTLLSKYDFSVVNKLSEEGKIEILDRFYIEPVSEYIRPRGFSTGNYCLIYMDDSIRVDRDSYKFLDEDKHFYSAVIVF